MKEPGRVRIAFFCLILAATLRAESSAQLDPEVLRQQGLSHFRAGNFDEAAELFRRVIELEPENSIVRNELGMTHVRLGRLEEAIACFQAAIKLNPELVEARYNLGTQLFKLSRYDEAIRALSETVRIAPDDALAWNNLGVALARLDRHCEAIDSFKSALRIRPSLQETWMLLAASAFEVNPADAIAPLKEAIRLDPYGAGAVNSLGVVYSRIGKQQEAIRSFRQALAIRPDYPAAMYNLGAISLAESKRDIAMEQYSRLKTVDRELADRLFRGIHQGMVLTLVR